MLGTCAYCGEILTQPDRCAACKKGQPAAVEDETRPAAALQRSAPIPGGAPFTIGIFLIVLGIFIPFVALIGGVLVFVGAATFGSAVWSRLNPPAPPPEE